MKLSIIIFSILFFSLTISHAQEIKQDSLLNKPIISWGDYYPGKIKADTFVKQKQIKLPKDFALKKAIVYFTSANFPIVEKFDIYSQDLTKLQHAINKCIPGTVVIFEKILVVYKKKQEIFLLNGAYLLY